ncbi:MAG: alpha/beta hydrolase [Bacteroidaceae bacterium]|nr:alpha/beta hydrolase [Bacteroidaceae bacterium]
MQYILITILYFIPVCVSSQINIWDYPSNDRATIPKLSLPYKGESQKRNCVELYPYIISGTNNTAVIVCPGGSYFWHDMETEGHLVAKWLNSQGISAFVLNYRTATVPAFIFHYRIFFRGNRYPDAQDDLRQALKVVRDKSKEFGINPNAIGAMGFSAGGHLAMSSAELFPFQERPDFLAIIYPVVSFTDDCTHKRSRRGLLGENKKNNEYLTNLLSLEKHVPNNCPPVFLVNCKDDPIVHCHNSELLDSALSAKKQPHLYIQYQTGGHGFGASETKGTEECRQWKPAFIQWLKNNNLLKKH